MSSVMNVKPSHGFKVYCGTVLGGRISNMEANLYPKTVPGWGSFLAYWGSCAKPYILKYKEFIQHRTSVVI